MRCWSTPVLALVLLPACGGAVDPSPPLPGRPAVVEVKMREFAFDYPVPVSAGRVVFRVHNVGKLLHRITVIALPEDVPPILEQLQGSQRRSVTPFAGMRPQRPGESASFAVDLTPGVRYALICFVRDESGSHARQGMGSEFRAGGPEAKPPPPTTTTTAAPVLPSVAPSSQPPG